MVQKPDPSDRLFREIFDLAYDAIFMLDPEADSIVDANQAALRLLGCTREELAELSLSETLGGAATKPWLDPKTEIDQGWIGPLMLRTRNAEEIATETSVSRIVATGKPYLIAAARRLDSRHRQELELARVAQLSMVREVASALAHEVNQPLCAIVLSAQTAQRTPRLKDPVDETLAHIVEQGHRAGDAVHHVRQLLRAEPYEAHRLDVNETIREIYGLAQERCRHAGVSLKVDLTTALPRILGDRLHLQEVFLHLVANGVEAMGGVASGGGILIQTRPQGVDAVSVTVTDRGGGVPAADRNRIFDAFYTTKPGHLGLGLTISRSIIESHGARLAVTPGHKGGAVFRFSLTGRA